MNIIIEKSFPTAVAPTRRVLEAACMFGLGVDESLDMTIVPRTELTLPRPGVVFITGPSGGGKSTVLRLIASACRDSGRTVIDLDDLPPPPDRPLVDGFDLSLEKTMSLLSMAGLADAFVMLRRPGELSDGQRARLRIARAMAAAECESSDGGAVILADEFGATLDRLTALVLARSAARWTRRAHHTLIAATTHDDLLEAFEPETLISKDLGEGIEVISRHENTAGHQGNHRRDAVNVETAGGDEATDGSV